MDKKEILLGSVIALLIASIIMIVFGFINIGDEEEKTKGILLLVFGFMVFFVGIFSAVYMYKNIKNIKNNNKYTESYVSPIPQPPPQLSDLITMDTKSIEYLKLYKTMPDDFYYYNGLDLIIKTIFLSHLFNVEIDTIDSNETYYLDKFKALRDNIGPLGNHNLGNYKKALLKKQKSQAISMPGQVDITMDNVNNTHSPVNNIHSPVNNTPRRRTNNTMGVGTYTDGIRPVKMIYPK